MTISTNISPPDPRLLNDPQHWRDKADEALAKADLMSDPDARMKMENVVVGYQRMAEQAERFRLGNDRREVKTFHAAS